MMVVVMVMVMAVTIMIVMIVMVMVTDCQADKVLQCNHVALLAFRRLCARPQLPFWEPEEQATPNGRFSVEAACPCLTAAIIPGEAGGGLVVVVVVESRGRRHVIGVIRLAQRET